MAMDRDGAGTSADRPALREGGFHLEREEAAPEALGAQCVNLVDRKDVPRCSARHMKPREAALPAGQHGNAILPGSQRERRERFSQLKLDDPIRHGLAPHRHLAELQAVQPRELALAAQQRRGRAAFHHAAILQHDDLVGIGHRRETMRDDHDGASACIGIEGILDRALGFAVERVGRLVQQQDVWIAQDGAGKGDTLPLAA